MDLLNPLAESYAGSFTSPLDKDLQKNEQQTLAENEHAVMHSGHVQGKALEFFSRMIKPRRILEIGTFTGFSAVCLAKGLTDGGILHTIEIREQDALASRDFIRVCGYERNVKVHVGNALDIIPELNEEWDIVFIDADKLNYINYYELTLPRLRKDGFIISDNVLFHGQVLEQPVKGKNATAIQAFNEHVKADERVEQVLLTIRDGLLIIRKK